MVESVEKIPVNGLVALQLLKAGVTKCINSTLCHCFYSVKGYTPDASESTESLQPEGSITSSELKL